MGTEGGSGAAGEPPQQGAHLDAGLAVINAFDDLYNQTADKAGKDSDTAPPMGVRITRRIPEKRIPKKGKLRKKTMIFFSLNPKITPPEPPKTSRKR